MRKKILSWLLHHANRDYKSETFYIVKDKILSKYGVCVGYDFQKMDGKRCFGCDGTGSYVGWSWHTNRKYKEPCYKCDGTGWYILPHWNVLKRIKFGKYTFHKPVDRIYKKPEIGSVIIDGYVSHTQTKYSTNARVILYLLFDYKAYIARTKQTFGLGRYMNPGFNLRLHLNNLVYWYKHRIPKKRIEIDYSNDDLPF